ncbi:MAG: hypothetical protein ACE5NG_19740 [bacterium]
MRISKRSTLLWTPSNRQAGSIYAACGIKLTEEESLASARKILMRMTRGEVRFSLEEWRSNAIARFQETLRTVVLIQYRFETVFLAIWS